MVAGHVSEPLSGNRKLEALWDVVSGHVGKPLRGSLKLEAL